MIAYREIPLVKLFACLFLISHIGIAEASKPGPPPWAAKSIKANQVPEVFYSQWYKAENQKKCAILVLTAANKEPTAKPRT